MNCTRALGTSNILTKQSAAQVLKALNLNGVTTKSLARPVIFDLQRQCLGCASPRPFSTSRPALIKEFFPKPETDKIRETAPAWPHPGFTKDQMEAVAFAHRDVRNWSDRVALAMIRTMRWGLDLATGYKHGNGHHVTERQYMIRNIFLESVAGVPGMVAGMLRHLHSMRRMKRDNGWMETLLEE